ncbi:GNAT family N-acetyltransferase [uncultured Megasphaera sp.]|uniref:GNAT family N-acetyltransferase n=1 Tax=uncultured Megasphaera sp. TaxID=165188 RepID=UPI002659A43F|nr:GNAT family N-acetyltransferase [uncultured Megasphaera sp.]
MTIQCISPAERTPALLEHLTALWEQSVRETHHFLSEPEILAIKPCVPQAMTGIETLLVLKEHDALLGFMGLNGKKLEMLFLHPKFRGKGYGRQLIAYGMAHYGVDEVTVNEQNPQAVGFYEQMGFSAYKRTAQDEQGGPYPLLYMKRTTEI